MQVCRGKESELRPYLTGLGLKEVPATDHWFLVLEKDTPHGGLSVELLAFETAILGRPVARIKQVQMPGTSYALKRSYLKALLLALEDWCKQNQVYLISFRGQEEELAVIHTLTEFKFRFVETYINFSHDLKSTPDLPPPHFLIRKYEPPDQQILMRIARDNLVSSRFHADPQIEQEFARQTRAQWTSNLCTGRAEILLVAIRDGQPAGFVAGRTVTQKNKPSAILELIAVDKPARGNKIGTYLVKALIGFYQGRVSSLRVGTQGKNERAIQMYQNCGFLFSGLELTFHRIFT